MEPAAFTAPAALESEVAELLTRYPAGKQRAASVMVLHAIQSHLGAISRDALEWAAARLSLNPIHLYELVTFYPMFREHPPGRHHLRVCRTLSCALAGGDAVHERICRRLGLDVAAHGPQTTADGRFTVELVECLASCGTAPVLMCNDALHEGVSPQRAEELITQCP
jgi:NADH-quinone oxidoreductase subunit E